MKRKTNKTKPAAKLNPLPIGLGKKVRVKAIRIVKRGGRKLIQVFK